MLAIRERLAGMRGALEIGPGPGALTSMLCASCERVIAVELDAKMAPALAESAPCAEVALGDALKVDLGSLLGRLPEQRAIVSNMPYNITGPLLGRIASLRAGFAKAVVMMQREVAERVLAAPGGSSRGSLSVFLQLQFEISRVIDVPRDAFLPPPKVESTVLELVPRSFELAEDQAHRLFGFVRSGFRQPRKTLANNLASSTGRARDEVLTWIEGLGLSPTARPQDPGNDVWIALWRRSLD